MADVTLTVEAGVCGFKTVVIAAMDDEMNITYKIKSECPEVRAMAKELEPMALFDVIASPFTENIVYRSCSCLPHVACPVPCSMVKAGEAAGELALKKDVSLKFD